MNLRDLRYIVAIADQGHFGRAAETCHVSQPTLSGQVAKLETELDVQIFQRASRKIIATEAGREIIAHARRALAAADDLVASARAHRDPLIGNIRMGVIPTIAPYLMPYVLPGTATGLPEAPLVLVEDLTENLVPMVTSGRLDCALIATQVDPAHLTSTGLFEEAFYVVAPPNHAFAAARSIHKDDLDPATLLLLTDGHCFREQALDLCGDPLAGSEAMADMRATSLETLLHLVAAGYGITLVPQLVIECGRAAASDLVARPIEGNGASRQIVMIYRKNSPREKALLELARIVRQSVPDPLQRLDAQELLPS